MAPLAGTDRRGLLVCTVAAVVVRSLVATGVVAGGGVVIARRSPLGLRTAAVELAEELVEQVAHARSLGEKPDQGRWSEVTALAKPASTRSASLLGVIAATRAGSHLNAARITSGQRHGRLWSSGG